MSYKQTEHSPLGGEHLSTLAFPRRVAGFVRDARAPLEMANPHLHLNNQRLPPVKNNVTGWWLGHPSEEYDFVNWDDDINPIFLGK